MMRLFINNNSYRAIYLFWICLFRAFFEYFYCKVKVVITNKTRHFFQNCNLILKKNNFEFYKCNSSLMPNNSFQKFNYVYHYPSMCYPSIINFFTFYALSSHGYCTSLNNVYSIAKATLKKLFH